MYKKVATHDKIFHADEVTAIALLKIFTQDKIEVLRVDHATKDFSRFDIVIDVGRKFDGVKYFDHHQHKGGKSSAGLIWDFIGLQKEYPKISKFIDMIDKHDTGVKKAQVFEYPNLIKCFNQKDIYSHEQDKAFDRAISFAMTVIESMAEGQKAIKEAEEVVANSTFFDGNHTVLKLSTFTQHWSSHINGEKTPHIKAVIWEDSVQNNYKVALTPKRVGSFTLNAKAFTQDSSMEFVHSSGHFAVANNEEILKNFLYNQKII